MIRSGKAVLGGLALVSVLFLFTSTALARPSSDFKIMIFPLECSVDLLNVGVGTLRQLTPENCMDPEIEPGIPGNVTDPIWDSDVATESKSSHHQLSKSFGGVSLSLEQLSMTALPDSPEVKKTSISDRLRNETSAVTLSSQWSMAMLGMVIIVPLLAVLYGAIHPYIGKMEKK